jgi:MFS transporter, AAHS family, benzoate transport protein
VGASTLGTQILAYAYAGEFYPTAIRSTGLGFASGIGRLGAILAPILIGALVSLRLALEQNFMAIGFAGLLGTIAVMLINHGRSASTHHHDAAKEAEQAGAASVAAGTSPFGARS